MIQPLKYHGGKHHLAKRIVAMMPAHLHYVEPYAGGLSVLLAKDPEGVSEVVNDIDGELVNFFRVLQRDESFERFYRRIVFTTFAEDEFCQAATPTANPVDRAVAFFVRNRQSRQGLMRDFATLSRTRTRRGMNEQVSSWLTAIESLPEFVTRIRRVVILNQPAVKVIRSQDGPQTLHYLDPPYVPDTRVARRAYQHEMTVDDHTKLLDTITQCEGMVMLSGYPNGLYDGRLRDWQTVDIKVANSASGVKVKPRMTERLWINFMPARRSETE